MAVKALQNLSECLLQLPQAAEVCLLYKKVGRIASD